MQENYTRNGYPVCLYETTSRGTIRAIQVKNFIIYFLDTIIGNNATNYNEKTIIIKPKYDPTQTNKTCYKKIF